MKASRWMLGRGVAFSGADARSPPTHSRLRRIWSSVRPRGSLFRKYFLAMFLAVVVPVGIHGSIEAWFGYHDQRERLNDLLGVEARSAADKIEGFLEGITSQLGWLVQLPWTEEADERRRIDALRLLRQVPAIVNLTLVDGAGRERLFVSRIGLNRVESRTNLSQDPAVLGARSRRLWFGEVSYYRGSEPYLTIATAGNRPSVGIVVAEVNLKLIWDVISAIKVGATGHAYVLDAPGRLIAHPDISLVLRGVDETTLRPFRETQAAVAAAGGTVTTGRDGKGRDIVAAGAAVKGPNWTVIAEQPLSEAFGPIYAALQRTAWLLLAGSVLAGLLAFALARRMTKPIQLLEQGTERIGAGQFDHRIEIRSGDELQRLADSFNAMATELAVSQERQERIGKLKRFLAPQVAELVDRAGDDGVLEGRHAKIVAVFCDLRGFTAFSAKAAPEEVMSVLSEYYGALGQVITRYEATLTGFSGDGLMVLVNAPVSVPDPAVRASDMALDMQDTVQVLIKSWRDRGYQIGFGVGLAMGKATVGRIGTDSRSDYTAIGPVVNLASRLCASAADGEVLINGKLADALQGRREFVALGRRSLKGFDDGVRAYRLRPRDQSADVVEGALNVVRLGSFRSRE